MRIPDEGCKRIEQELSEGGAPLFSQVLRLLLRL